MPTALSAVANERSSSRSWNSAAIGSTELRNSRIVSCIASDPRGMYPTAFPRTPTLAWRDPSAMPRAKMSSVTAWLFSFSFSIASSGWHWPVAAVADIPARYSPNVWFALAVAAVDKQLHEQLLPLDLAVLGMGEDGHTASFFKDAEGLEVALAPGTQTACCAVRPPRAPHARMTLTLNTLLASRRLLLHVVGVSKLAVLQVAMQPGPINLLPVRAVLHQRQRPLEIYYATRE